MNEVMKESVLAVNELVAEIEQSNPLYLSENREQKIDNLVLCTCGEIVQADNRDLILEVTYEVYAAAKVMFTKHPGAAFTYDLPAALSGVGSPWEAVCQSPEEWVIHFARRWAETDEGMIEGTRVADILMVYERLVDIGVPTAVLRENLHVLCYAQGQHVSGDDQIRMRKMQAVSAV